jgi:hypothetical protein
MSSIGSLTRHLLHRHADGGFLLRLLNPFCQRTKHGLKLVALGVWRLRPSVPHGREVGIRTVKSIDFFLCDLNQHLFALLVATFLRTRATWSSCFLPRHASGGEGCEPVGVTLISDH